MILLLPLLVAALPLLLTFRSPRWRRSGRIVALVGLLLVVLVTIGGVIGAGAVG